MQKNTRHIRAAIFGITILFFFMPFVIISCPGHGSVSITGTQLSSGTIIRGSQFSEFTPNQRIKPEPYAFLALFCAIAGIIFSYIKNKRLSFILCITAAIFGIILLMLLKNRIYIQVRRLNEQADLVFRYAIGFWLSITGFTTALIVTLLLNPIMPFAKIKFPIRLPYKRRARRTTIRKTRRTTRKRR